MNVYAVTGDPVLHSLSPLLYVPYLNQDINYTRLIIDRPSQIPGLLTKGILSGLNITAPFKEPAFDMLDNHDEYARETQAVNLILLKNRKPIGYNTDVRGLISLLKKTANSLKGGKAVIFGAGGAARAIAVALKKFDVVVWLVSRNQQHAKWSANICNCNYIRSNQLEPHISEANIMASALPVPNPFLTNIPFRKDQLVIDANYQFPELIEKARQAGSKIISGTCWLGEQARFNLELISGIIPEENLFKEPYIEKLRNKSKKILIAVERAEELENFEKVFSGYGGIEKFQISTINSLDNLSDILHKSVNSISFVQQKLLKKLIALPELEGVFLIEVNSGSGNPILFKNDAVFLNDNQNAKRTALKLYEKISLSFGNKW